MTKEIYSVKKRDYLKSLVILFIVAAITVRLLFVFLLPFGQTTSHHLEGLNDEPSHYNYVKFLAVNHSFPVLTHWVLEKDAFIRNEFEYHQAPLYYIVCVPLYWIFGEKGALVPCRLLSAIFGMLSVWMLILIVRDQGYQKKARAGTALFAGFLFSHLYFSSVVSNDALSWLLALLLTRGLLQHEMADKAGVQGVWSFSTLVVIFSCTAGLLTKSSFLIFLPVIFGFYLYRFYKSHNAADIVRAFIIPGISGLLSLPWYIRNITLYHTITGIPAPSVTLPFSFSTFIGFIKGTIKYFWFPMQNLEGGTLVFAILTFCGAALLAIHGVIAFLWMLKKRNRNFSTILLVLLFTVTAAAAFWYFVEWQNPEARFLFPALGSIIFFVAVPAYRAFERVKIERLYLPYCLLSGLFPYLFLVFAK